MLKTGFNTYSLINENFDILKVNHLSSFNKLHVHGHWDPHGPYNIKDVANIYVIRLENTYIALNTD